MSADETSFLTQLALSDVAGVVLGGLAGYFVHVWQSSRHEVTDAAKRYIERVLGRSNVVYTKLCDQIEAMREAGVHLFTDSKQFQRFFAYLDDRRIDHPWKSDPLFREIDALRFFQYTNEHNSYIANPEALLETAKGFVLQEETAKNHRS